MKIPKPTDADRERFASLVPNGAGVETKPMFGNVGAFVNGNMFMGLFGSDIGLKLPDSDRERLLEQPGTGPFGPDDRPMSGYVTLPAGWSVDDASAWVEAALAAAAALPQKAPKPRAAKATKTTKKQAPR